MTKLSDFMALSEKILISPQILDDDQANFLSLLIDPEIPIQLKLQVLSTQHITPEDKIFAQAIDESNIFSDSQKQALLKENKNAGDSLLMKLIRGPINNTMLIAINNLFREKATAPQLFQLLQQQNLTGAHLGLVMAYFNPDGIHALKYSKKYGNNEFIEGYADILLFLLKSGITAQEIFKLITQRDKAGKSFVLMARYHSYNKAFSLKFITLLSLLVDNAIPADQILEIFSKIMWVQRFEVMLASFIGKIIPGIFTGKRYVPPNYIWEIDTLHDNGLKTACYDLILKLLKQTKESIDLSYLLRDKSIEFLMERFSESFFKFSVTTISTELLDKKVIKKLTKGLLGIHNDDIRQQFYHFLFTYPPKHSGLMITLTPKNFPYAKIRHLRYLIENYALSANQAIAWLEHRNALASWIKDYTQSESSLRLLPEDMKSEIIAKITGLTVLEAADLILKINLLQHKEIALDKKANEMLAWKYLPLTKAEADDYLTTVESQALGCPSLPMRSSLFLHAAHSKLLETRFSSGPAVDLKEKLLCLTENPGVQVWNEKPSL